MAGEARRVQEMKSVENSDQLVLGSQTSAMTWALLLEMGPGCGLPYLPRGSL